MFQFITLKGIKQSGVDDTVGVGGLHFTTPLRCVEESRFVRLLENYLIANRLALVAPLLSRLQSLNAYEGNDAS